MENGNARVTVAVLGNQVANLSAHIGALDIKIDNLTNTIEKRLERTTEVEKCIAVLKHELDNLDDKVDNMDDRYKKINIATAVGATIGTTFATVLAIFGIRQ